MKRTVDVLFAAGGLLLLSPVFLWLAIWVKLDSRGPVLFRQERIGRYGHPFKINKFRTMRVDASGPPITVGADPRVTRSGHFMRAKKLDELPQLWNVLCGTMSLVGPRPEVPEYVADWPTDVCQEILSLRPGLTDPTALRFLDEQSVLAGAQNPELFYREILTPIKLTGYVAYVRERTLAKDLSIILATLVAAVRVSGRGHD